MSGKNGAHVATCFTMSDAAAFPGTRAYQYAIPECGFHYGVILYRFS